MKRRLWWVTRTSGRRSLAAGALAFAYVCACQATDSASVDTGSTEDDIVSPAEPACADVAPSPLRRLTPEQLVRTVDDLFPHLGWMPVMVGAEPDTGLDNAAEKQHPSALLVYQVHRNAVEIAARVVALPDGPTACDATPDPMACGGQFLETLLPKVLRRPATAKERLELRQLWQSAAQSTSLTAALELGLQALFQHPGFLYFDEVDDRELDADHPRAASWVAVGPYAMASRLSYLLWNTMPDDELFRAAAAEELLDVAAVQDQAKRMLADPRSDVAVINFARQVFELDKVDDIVPKHSVLPAWSDELQQAMREEMDRMVLASLARPESSLADLLLAEHTWVDAALADIYGVPAPMPGRWERRRLDPTQRVGLLTTPGFLAAHSVYTYASPVRRGVFVLSRLMCSPPPPPVDVDTNLPPDDGVPKTNRERFEAHVANPACAGCHAAIDGIGFGFEGYDAVGRYRTEDGGYPVDDSGTVRLDGEELPFEGAVELAHHLAASPQVSACAVRWWYAYAMGRAVTDVDRCELDRLEQRFADSGGNIRDLLVALVTSDAFRFKPKEAR